MDGQLFLAVCQKQCSLECPRVWVCSGLSALARGGRCLGAALALRGAARKPAGEGSVRGEVRAGPLADEPPRKGVRTRPRPLFAAVLRGVPTVPRLLLGHAVMLSQHTRFIVLLFLRMCVSRGVTTRRLWIWHLPGGACRSWPL